MEIFSVMIAFFYVMGKVLAKIDAAFGVDYFITGNIHADLKPVLAIFPAIDHNDVSPPLPEEYEAVE